MGDFIKEVWDNSAESHGASHWASWGDEYAISLEIEEIGKHIKDNQKILDIGCSNGFAAFKHAEDNFSIDIIGVDFSEKMIEQAQKVLKEHPKENVSFALGDIRDIEFEDNTFDLVYTSRVVINLPNWEDQMQAILECIRVTKKGGTIILSEAFWEPLVKLNTIRSIMGLDSLVEHDFNRYIKKAKLKEFLSAREYSYEVKDFTSVYYFGSRVLREIITDYQNYKGYDNPINKEFYSLEKKYSGGDVGIQQAFIINK